MNDFGRHDPRHAANLTAAQRRDEVIDLLARAVVRLHQRAALGELPTLGQRGRTGLDSCGGIPLSVADDRHPG